MHGGAKGSGGPVGARNGNFRQRTTYRCGLSGWTNPQHQCSEIASASRLRAQETRRRGRQL